MKKILKSAGLLALCLCALTACEDDRDSNPTVSAPKEIHLNTPALANTNIDLTYSEGIELTCSQPDYGFPAYTQYTVQVSLNSDMSDLVEMESPATSNTITVDPTLLAAQLTTMELGAGKTEADFPMDIPVYLRVRTNMLTAANVVVDGTEALSNTICLSNVHLNYSLAPVNTPSAIYAVGNFCSWDWGNCFDMIQVYGPADVFWRMIYIDESGIKFNTAKDWDGGEIGFSGIKVGGDKASDIIDNGGNIASSNPGWYLVIITTSVEGRNIVYDVQFNEPTVWLMGPVVGNSSWNELEEGWSFTVPSEMNADFVSPAFAASVPGGTGDGVRAYVKVPGYDWWKSEFICIDGTLVYRATGGDQDRVAGNAGQRMYINFSTGESSIK